MNEKSIDQLIHILSVISAVAILLGAIFKLQHYPYGGQMVWGGLISSFLLSSFEISRLKKKIKKLEERKIEE